jgi:signal transduction histidine kinase
MTVLRRITVLVGVIAMLVHRVLGPESILDGPAECVAAVVFVVNEILHWFLDRLDEARLARLVNSQITLDTLALALLLHLGGGISNPGIVLLVPPFFIYGAILPLGESFGHVGVLVVELVTLAVAEYTGSLPHYASGFYAADIYQRVDFLILTIVLVTAVSALCAAMGHYLRVLVRVQEERASALAEERGALLESNQREAARVRVLLDVAQHVSGTHSIDDFLGAVCDTTVTLARVPRVEVFLWDEDASCLRLAAARGLAGDQARTEDKRYPGDMPIVARLRAGELVDFGAFPSQALVEGHVQTPFRRAFAAPLVCRGSFQGALFVGYNDESKDEFVELVLGIARQAALALANVRTMAQQQEDAEVSNILLQVSQALSACLDEDALWRLVVRAASEVLDASWSVACRFDDREKTFTVTGAHGFPDEAQPHFAELSFSHEEWPTVTELLSRREVMLGDESRVPHFLPHGTEAVASWLAIPLYRGSWVAGLLTAGSFGSPRGFTRRQLRLAEGLGHHASIALQNARMVADLEAADQLKSEFVSTMSHELRTPLNVIIGYTEMLREGAVGPMTPGQLELVSRLDARGRELLELIEATLHVGRLEAGRETVEIQPIEFCDLVKALQASTAGLPRAPEVAFEWEGPIDLHDRVMTDRTKLALVVRNLVSNAFKFTSEGRVVVRMMPGPETLVVEVEDSGIGISAEHLPVIFDMFRQVDGSMTRRHGGVGLGLYIVKQFARRLGGTVEVRSTIGEGTTFRLTVPIAVRDDRRPAAFQAA